MRQAGRGERWAGYKIDILPFSFSVSPPLHDMEKKKPAGTFCPPFKTNAQKSARHILPTSCNRIYEPRPLLDWPSQLLCKQLCGYQTRIAHRRGRPWFAGRVAAVCGHQTISWVWAPWEGGEEGKGKRGRFWEGRGEMFLNVEDGMELVLGRR